ncbi:hypothetical protein M501DRAFT_978717 [Patellaria atrata CBS 101060]|uniref:Tail specific protease domain-containing protein n=1 Tax=Patellaria atrata CBS 101060 TaxID=1346257 RepID=A0A9P4S818_9PEZI|nr:hypothetical protein M501DRAFT_978717 [Patellaria atrata CBS 101060]
MLRSLFLLTFLSTVVSSSPISDTRRSYPRQNPTNTTNPCASVSSLYFEQDVPTPTVPAKLAYDCLNDIPFNSVTALALMKAIRPYSKWQSTLAYLKDPPAEYEEKVQEAIDVFGEFDKIEAKINAGSYKSEYEFGFELYRVFQRTHDGHFSYVPDTLGIFNFARPAALVSVSEDGAKLPSIFVYTDILLATSANATFKPSPIVNINGEDAVSYLENWSQYGSLQDRDALWNNLFYELAHISLGNLGSGTGVFSGGGRGRLVYPGPVTEFTFQNGSTSTIENFARVQIGFAGLNSGRDIYNRYLRYNTTTLPGVAQADGNSGAAVTPAPGYPSPVIRHSGNLNGGYYLEGEGFEDVAVLAVPNFVASQAAEVEFQEVNENFIKQAKADGKKKLIIDVSANGGGTILQGYDLFKILFPDLEPYGATRFRATESFDIIGQYFSAYSEEQNRTLVLDDTSLGIVSSVWNYKSDVDVKGQHFDSWEEKFGPVQNHGDNYTSIIRWDLNDPLITLNSGGIEIHGYGQLANVTKERPFAAEDIVIVYDGYCASTCTIFSEFMRQQGGVKTIALGGRPNSNIIQAVGGVKGTNSYPWLYFLGAIEQVYYSLATEKERTELFRETEIGEYNTFLPFNRAASQPGVNSRDGLREGDESGIPLQFVYEAADCRIFYTPEMTVDVTTIWKAAADTQWNGKSSCVGAGMTRRDTTKRAFSPKRLNSADVNAFRNSLDLHTEVADVEVKGFMLP